jgi:hypothetical protein
VAAWQLHVARIEEELRSGWGSHLERMLGERFDELAQQLTGRLEASVRDHIRTELDSTRETERRAAGLRRSEELNQACRRLLLSAKQEDWTSALLDSAASYAKRAALFSLRGEEARLEKCSEPITLPPVQLAEAAAFQEAVQSREPVVAAWTPREISLVLAQALDSGHAARVAVFPIESRQRPVALLLAEGDGDEVDLNALELLAATAGLVLEVRAHRNAEVEPASPGVDGLVTLRVPVDAARAAAGEGGPARPAWSDLPADEQDLHLRAQRFARVQVAEMRLYKSPAVKQGRALRALYDVLKEDIDRGREVYRERFVGHCPSMLDYFHVELVRTLANDDADLLGAEYPGPLV